MSALAEKIRNARLAAGLTQQQAAAQAGVALGTLRNAEKGLCDLRMSTFARIAEAIGLEQICGHDCDGSGSEVLLRPPKGGDESAEAAA